MMKHMKNTESILYRAKIKKHKLEDDIKYWTYVSELKVLWIGRRNHSEKFKTIFTETEWNNLGIFNNYNAKFEKIIKGAN